MTSPAVKAVPATGGGGGGPTSSLAGPAKVIPFPVLRRVAFLDRMADTASTCRNLDRYMTHILQQQRDAMRRRGIADDMIEAELAALDRAIKSRLEEYA
jgi:Family of unknown function (DUF6074)